MDNVDRLSDMLTTCRHIVRCLEDSFTYNLTADSSREQQMKWRGQVALQIVGLRVWQQLYFRLTDRSTRADKSVTPGGQLLIIPESLYGDNES
jgi:hypothetical protein